MKMLRHNWTKQEDSNLISVVENHGCEDWTLNSQRLKQQCYTANQNNRSGKQCRQRWYNHLNPNIKKSGWTDQQQVRLFHAQKFHGNKWKDICIELPGRTDNDVKNRFYSTLRRSLRRLNKYIGQKNSTSQMRQIKPSVLTSIIKFIYQNSGNEDNQFIGELKEIPELIFRFSTFKPVKNNMNTKIDSELKQKINLILNLVQKFKKSCEGRKKQKSKKLGTDSHMSSSNIFIKSEEQLVHEHKQQEISPQYPDSQLSGQNIESIFGYSRTTGPNSFVPRSINPIVTIRRKSSSNIDKQLSKMSQMTTKTTLKQQTQKYLVKIQEQQRVQQNPVKQEAPLGNPFEEESNGAFMPFQDPSVSYQQNFLDLVIVGKHMEPIQCQYNGQELVQFKEEDINEVLQENYQ